MNKLKYLILSVTTLTGAVIVFFAGQSTYRQEESRLKETAKASFKEAIHQEMGKREVDGPIIIHYTPHPISHDLSRPDSVTITDEQGQHRFRLDPRKDSLNITNDTQLRIAYSIALRKRPLQADSLNATWKKPLSVAGISDASFVRVAVTDEHGGEKVSPHEMPAWCTPSRRVYHTYLGYACEVELQAYLHYSVWEHAGKYLLFYFVLYAIFVIVAYRVFLFLSTHLVLRKQERSHGLVKEPETTSVHSYRIRQNIVFYAEEKTLVTNTVEVKKIPRQSSLLLELFLQNKDKDYTLTDEEIKNALWPDGSGYAERIHKAVGRLRLFLQKFDPSIDIKRGNNTYQLLL